MTLSREVLTVRKEYGGEAGPRGIGAAGVVHLSTPCTAEKHPIVSLQIPYSERCSRQEHTGERCERASHAHKRLTLQSSVGYQCSDAQVPNCCRPVAGTDSICLRLVLCLYSQKEWRAWKWERRVFDKSALTMHYFPKPGT